MKKEINKFLYFYRFLATVDILNIPKLRFKEFTDEWVYYKYKDIFNLNQGLQIPITERFLDYAPNRFFYITNEFLKPSSKKSYYIENPSPNVICTKEDILMTRTGNTGKVITNIAGVFHNNFFRIKYNPKNFNKDFICCILNQNKIQNKILTLAGSSTIPDLNHKDFYSIKSRFPKLKEQEKIAKFINTVDKKIENIENTISSLENQKKGLLQQIFSQKLRFKDENGNNYPNWEKKKLGDICKFTGGGTPSTSILKYWNGTIPWISSSDLQTNTIHKIKISRYITNEAVSNSSTKIIPKNSILIVSRVGVGKVAISNCVLCTSQDFTNITEINGNTTFYAYLLKYKMEQLTQNTQGTSIKGITTSDIKNIKLIVPIEQTEQTKIADFLSAFDRKLDNQKAQLEHWQQIKKGLLQQMFV